MNDKNLESMPDQASNSGKFLKTDGSNLSWADSTGGDTLPDQALNSGKFLTTNGTTLSWGDVGSGSVPTQVDPQTLTDAEREGITWGDRRFTWLWDENILVQHRNLGPADRSFTKLLNGIRGTNVADSVSGPGDNHTPYYLNAGGQFTLQPLNAVHYKFRGMYWMDNKEFKFPGNGNGISDAGDARFAAFGYKNNKLFWLGTCSNNNTDVDSGNHTNIQIPTANWTEEADLTYGAEQTNGHPKKWIWTENIDFYEKYIIKQVKLGRTIFHEATAYQITDNIHEFEFF